ncbi:unnamed protein product [Cochlearia groenlandica]
MFNSSEIPPLEAPPSTSTIGIIHPPPSDIRTIIEKTAQFVSRHGPEFGKRIIASNANNATFNFLHGSDPYHAFYRHKLAEFRAQAQDGAVQANAADDEGEEQI